MKEFYFLGNKTNEKWAVAFAPKSTPITHELVNELEGKDVLPFNLELNRVVRKGKLFDSSVDLSALERVWTDYPANTLSWYVLSRNVKLIFDNYLTGREGLE